MTTIPNLHDLLKSSRKNLGLSQIEAAKQLELSQPHLSQIENGALIPGKSALTKMSKVYKIPYLSLVISSLKKPIERYPEPVVSAFLNIQGLLKDSKPKKKKVKS